MLDAASWVDVTPLETGQPTLVEMTQYMYSFLVPDLPNECETLYSGEQWKASASRRGAPGPNPRPQPEARMQGPAGSALLSAGACMVPISPRLRLA